MNLRRHVVLLVLTAAVLPIVVGVLAVHFASPPEDSGEQDEQLARATAWLLTRELTGTMHSFRLGKELFDLPSLSPEETIGVLRLLYKQEEDLDVVALLDGENQAVVEPVFLRTEQIKAGTETAGRLPVNETDMGQFLGFVPIEAAREGGRAFSDAYINQRKNVAMIAGALVVPAGDGRKPWILAFERSLRKVHRMVSAGMVGPEFTMFVVDGGGRIVMHPDGDRFLKRELVDSHPAVAAFLRGNRQGKARWMDEAGESQVAAFQQLDFMDWAVVVQRQLLPLLSLGWRLPLWVWAAWMLVALVILASVLWLERGVKRMLSQMQDLRDDAELRASELKRIQASVLESGKLSAIGDLGAGVAHEFNNPVGGILGLTQLLLRKKPEDDPDRRFLERIEEEAKRCKGITDNLLRFSEQQSFEHREPMRLERVVGLAADLMTQKLRSQRIQIERNFGSDTPRVMGNEGQLQRAVINVLLNAETAMMPDGGQLTLCTERNGRWAVIRVKDTGRGIHRENIDRVFEPFFTTKDNWKGAGLGLSEVYQIVKEHGGEVSVHSTEGQGTEVVFRLPPDVKSRAGKSTAAIPLA